MHLVAPLAAGIIGAPNGTVEVYKRGTGTRATWYADFEASLPQSSGSDIALDGNGSAEVYVNELVDVVVRDVTGASVREFTAGSAAGNIEVISPSFTGADYATALAGTAKPTLLQTVLDAWLTSAGAADFKVLVGVTATLLKDAVAGKQFFNVTDATYGADGNGTTDDGVAIQAAISAAHAAGGGIVYFPAGTYRLTTELIWYEDISLIGAGADQSIITMDHATAKTFNADTATSGTWAHGTFVAFLRFKHSQANSGNIFDLSGVTRTHAFINCVIGDGTNSNGTLITRGAAVLNLHLTGCYLSGTAALLIASDVRAEGCTFSLGTIATLTDSLVTCATVGHFANCELSALGAAAGTVKIIEYGTGARGTVTGCHFGGKEAGATVYGIALTGTGHTVSEYGNSWKLNTSHSNPPNVLPEIVPYFFSVTDSTNDEQQTWGSRNGFYEQLPQSGGGTLTVSSQTCALIQVLVSDNTNFILQLNKAPYGSLCTILIYSAGGAGTGTITWGSNVVGGAGFTIATTKHRGYTFRMAEDSTGTNAEWILAAAGTGDL